MLDADTVRTYVFELAGVEDDDADADAGADTKVDSSTSPASTTTSDDARMNDGSGGSDGSPDSGRGSRAPLRLASISATRGPGSHTRGRLGAGAGAGIHRRGANIGPDVNSAR